MMLRKSDAYYKVFKRIISYLQYTVTITPQIKDQEVIKRNFDRGEKCFNDIITFLENKIENGEINPKFLYPSDVAQMSDYALATSGWFFEWISEFETIYFLCISNLCSVCIQQGEVNRVKEQFQKAKMFVEHLKNNVSIFLYEEEIRKIEKLEAELIS
jgi:hypothetical protein